MTAPAAPAPVPVMSRLRRRARLLVQGTIAWNVVEVSAALVALWYLRGVDDERGGRAGRLIGVGFWALAAFVAVDAVVALVGGERPDTSVPGIVMTSLSVVVMPLFARAKRRTARRLGSSTLASEAAETALCAWISGVALAGVALDAALGWWWADPAAALAIAAVAAREGRSAWRGGVGADGCC